MSGTAGSSVTTPSWSKGEDCPQPYVHPGGIGIAEKGFEMITELWQATLKAVEECPCTDGCPSCVQSPKCDNNNQPLDKEAAIVLLEELVRELVR